MTKPFGIGAHRGAGPARRKAWVSIAVAAAWLAAACGAPGQPGPDDPASVEAAATAESAFATLVPVPAMNASLAMAAPREANDFKLGSDVVLTIENLSADEIRFPTGFGARIFVRPGAGGSWEETENIAIYVPGGEETLRPTGVVGSRSLLVVVPRLDGARQPVGIRVIIVGTIYRDGTHPDGQTGAYVDVWLTP